LIPSLTFATMTDDLRKQRSESSEGKGRARRAWQAYADAVNRFRPKWVDEALRDLALRWTEEMVGFWVCWHLYGGFEGLEKAGWHRATIYRKLKRFRLVFHKHPDEFELVGVNLDLEAFWGHYLAKPGAEE
jgi:hypothetical protein